MPKRPSTDPSLFAKNVLDHIINKYDPEAADTTAVKLLSEVPQKNPAAVALGKLGGSKGGRIRAENLSAKRRSQIAKKAAAARWKKS